MAYDKNPKVTVITISFNAAKHIEETIKSVVEQTYNNIEYIIIDGGSKDGTVDIIKKYADHISFWKSEPDEGIYNAMNKGLGLTSGEWVIFMNSGDHFADRKVIERMFAEPIDEKYAFVYGNTILNTNGFLEMEIQNTVPHHKYMPACHQSIFCRSSYAKKFGFNEKYKIIADIDAFSEIYKENPNHLHKEITVAVFEACNGVSSTNVLSRNKEIVNVVYKHKALKRISKLVKLEVKNSFKNFFHKNNKSKENAKNFQVIYDYQIFYKQRFGGISRYFCELAKHVDCKTRILVRFSINYYLCNNYKVKGLIKLPHFIFRKLKKKLFEADKKHTCKKISRTGAFMFHPTYYDTYFLPYIGQSPYVVTVHDLIHEIFPQAFDASDNTAEIKKEIIKKATRIIAISENTKRDLITYYNVPEEKIDVIYHATDMTYTKLDNLKLHKDYILFVGDRNHYKNFEKLLEAFALIHKSHPNFHLICTGRKFNSNEQNSIAKLGLSGYVEQQRIDDTSLAELYQKASAFVYPSLYEGFGIPILEAWANHCPVVLSRASCFPEIAGEAGVYFNPNEVKDIANSIANVIDNTNLRKELIEKGNVRLKMFSWEKTAQQTMDTYRKAWTEQEGFKDCDLIELK